MNINGMVKNVTLSTVAVGVNLGVQSIATKAIGMVAPNFLTWDDEWSKKQKFIKVGQLIGASVAVAVVSGLVAGYATQMVEKAVWPEPVFDVTIE